MDDRERMARRFIAEAEANRPARPLGAPRARRGRAADERPPEFFCRCLGALGEGGRCGRCAGDPEAAGFCRRCLGVHGPSRACRDWRAGECRWCHEVHGEPLADCLCRRCGSPHVDEAGRYTAQCADGGEARD